MDAQPLLRVENLSLFRDNRPVLQDVNLIVRSGRVHALAGINGSGKSSLAYTLMGCAGYKPDQGSIWFGGEDITHLPIHERARLGLTLAWQEPVRFEGLTVEKYLTLGMQSPDRNRTSEALEMVNLPPRNYLRRCVDNTLSGGERKRVELAAIYTMRPRLAILDEPDSGIDALSLDDISRLIRRMAEAGTAVLLITHRDEMVEVADEASIMCLGTVIYTGNPIEAQHYYRTRCQSHAELLSKQPWLAPFSGDLSGE
jgi:Fe-S cluster assembly ATP-binding protein